MWAGTDHPCPLLYSLINYLHNSSIINFDLLASEARARHKAELDAIFKLKCAYEQDLKRKAQEFFDANSTTDYILEKKGKYFRITRRMTLNHENATEEVLKYIKAHEYMLKDKAHQPFFVVNSVVIIDGSGYTFEHVKSGHVLTEAQIADLENEITPGIFMKP